MTTRLQNLNRNKFDQDSGWCLRADYVLWSCLAPSVLRSNVFLSACSPVVWEEMRKSLKAQEVQIREHQIWKVQTLLDKVTRKLHLEWKVPFGGMNPWRYESFQDLWENHCFFYGLARRYRQLFWEDSASITLTVHDGWLEEIVNFHSSRANPKIVDNSSQCSGSWQRRSLQRVSLPSILVC